MRFVWDETKNRSNRAKHGFGFDVAKLVFDDPFHLSVPDRHEPDEERWRTVGYVGAVALLVVIHTYVEQNGEEIVRIISARKATRGERAIYEEEN